MSAEGKWLLANRSSDTARDAELSVESPFSWPHASRTCRADGSGGADVTRRVMWRVPLGGLRSAQGES